MKIITASLTDFEVVNSIVKEGQDDHSDALPHIFKKLDQVMPLKYFKELVDNPSSDVLIACLDDEIVGFAVMEICEAPAFESLMPRTYAYISDFGIKKIAQRRGIGRRLYEECVKWGRSRGASSLELNVWEFNQKAISFYESQGMETISRKMTLPL